MFRIHSSHLPPTVEEMWQLARGGEFTLVEYGAGTGNLCSDILRLLKQNSPLYGKLRYCIIEKSASMRAVERDKAGDNVSWYTSIRPPLDH